MTTEPFLVRPPSMDAGTITFSPGGNRGACLVIHPDGRLEHGPGFASDDEASVAFFDTLSRCFPTWLSELRQRAETAERALALRHLAEDAEEIGSKPGFMHVAGRLMAKCVEHGVEFDTRNYDWTPKDWRMRLERVKDAAA